MHEDTCDLLDDYLDQLLEGQSKENFEKHLLVCEQCADAFELQGELDSALRSYAESIDCPTKLEYQNYPLKRKDRSFEVQAVVAAIATIAAAILVAVWLPSMANENKIGKPPANKTLSQASDLGPNRTGSLQSLTTLSPSNSSIRVDTILPLDSAASAQTPTLIAPPIVRSIQCDGHVIVHSSQQEDDLTFVMLYPKVNSNKEIKLNAN